MSHVRFGIFLPQIRMTFEEIETRTRVAEAAGFDTVWFMDHLAAPAMVEADCLEGFTLATAIAARTERIRLGHMVLCNEFRHPALLAKMVATLDQISGGRLDLGLGWGSVVEELRTFGVGGGGARVRSERLAETLEILERAFTGEPIRFEGRHFQLDGGIARPRPVQDPLPIHIGGAGEKLTLPLVRRYASWWNCPSYGIERLAELRPLAGDAKVSAQHPIGLARDASERDAVEQLANRRFGTWGGLRVGTPDEIADALAAEVAIGVEGFVIQLHDFGAAETIELFAREVIPRVREAAG